MQEKKQWNEKRYYSLDYYIKERFGQKAYKVSLNAGMTCPNRDGTLGDSGCIFCSGTGSGDYAGNPALSITEQIEEEKRKITEKKYCEIFIAYFQAFTNTYAPLPYLRKIFFEAAAHPGIAAVSIATRPDCLSDEIMALLTEVNNRKPVWIELGLQTIHEETASFIRRGYKLSSFERAVTSLHKNNLTCIVHVIIGLPGEDKIKISETISYLAKQPIDGIKLQLLHILKNTDLAQYLNKFPILTMDEYTDIIISCIEKLPQNIVIHRLTGDGPKELLLAPLWSTQKKTVLNQINRKLKLRDTWQGKEFLP